MINFETPKEKRYNSLFKDFKETENGFYVRGIRNLIPLIQKVGVSEADISNIFHSIKNDQNVIVLIVNGIFKEVYYLNKKEQANKIIAYTVDEKNLVSGLLRIIYASLFARGDKKDSSVDSKVALIEKLENLLK